MLNNTITVSQSGVKQVYTYLNSELAEVNQIISSCFEGKEALIISIAEHFLQNRGKKIRPLLTILSAKLIGYTGVEHIKLAAAVELIHLATLLHDDVIDNSVLRRTIPSANFLWGNKASILAGDFFFSQAFKLMVGANSLASLELLAGASALIVEGEVKQLVNLQNKRLISRSEYFEIVSSKTASLFSASCKVAALLYDPKNIKLAQLLGDFGNLLGTIYQIQDDTLDYFSSRTGKERGIDLKEGKVTLPVILLRSLCSDAEKLLLEEIFIHKNIRTNDDFFMVLQMLQNYDILKLLKTILNELYDEALKNLHSVAGDQKAAEMLLEILYFATELNDLSTS